METLRKVWHWVRDHAVALLGALLAIGAAIAGIEYARRRIGGMKARVEVERALRDIAADTARRDRIVEEVDEKDEDVAAIDARLLENKKRIVSTAHDVEAMSDGEVLEAFDALGY